MGVVQDVVGHVERLWGALSGVDRDVRRANVRIEAQGRTMAGLVAGSPMIASLMAGATIVLVQLQSLIQTGRWRARRLAWNGTAFADDPNEADYIVMPRWGAQGFFAGARGHAVFVGTDQGNPPQGLYQAVAGEWSGIQARITGSPTITNGLHWYPWEQDDNGVGSPHTSTAMSKALLLASLAHDPLIDERGELPSGCRVTIHWDLVNGRWYFGAGVEQLVEVCP